MAIDSKSGTSRAPAWFGRYPLPPEELRPCVVRKGQGMPRLYGLGVHKVPTCLYVSTLKISSSEFRVPPGEYFEPCDIHGGEEVYYVARGCATVLEPETGRAHRVPAGSICYMPREAWHQTYNFEDEHLHVITFFAEKMWHDAMGTEVVYPGTPQHLRPDVETAVLPKARDPEAARLADPLCGRIGSYPVTGEAARSQDLIFVVTPERALNFVHGMMSRVLVSLFVSNEIFTAGQMVIPVGTETDQERHPGDEVMVVTQGEVSVTVPDETVTEKTVSVIRFELHEGDRMLVPAGFTHRYYNSGAQTARVMFSIAPGI